MASVGSASLDAIWQGQSHHGTHGGQSVMRDPQVPITVSKEPVCCAQIPPLRLRPQLILTVRRPVMEAIQPIEIRHVSMIIIRLRYVSQDDTVLDGRPHHSPWLRMMYLLVCAPPCGRKRKGQRPGPSLNGMQSSGGRFFVLAWCPHVDRALSSSDAPKVRHWICYLMFGSFSSLLRSPFTRTAGQYVFPAYYGCATPRLSRRTRRPPAPRLFRRAKGLFNASSLVVTCHTLALVQLPRTNSRPLHCVRLQDHLIPHCTSSLYRPPQQ